MRLLFITLHLLTTLVVLGQSPYQIIDLQGDDYVDNCIDLPSGSSIFCVAGRNPWTSTDQNTYILEVNSSFIVDTILVPGLKPPNKLYRPQSDNPLYIFGNDNILDSTLSIVRRSPTGYFNLINSFKLPGHLSLLGPIKYLHDKTYILGNIGYGSTNNQVFLIELDSLADSSPNMTFFNIAHKPNTIGMDIVSYNQNAYLLSFYGYPVQEPYANNQFVLLDSGLVNDRGKLVNDLFGYTQFLHANGNLYYTGRYFGSDTVPGIDPDIVIGIVDTFTDSIIDLRFEHFGKKDTHELEGVNNISSYGNYIFVGGTSNSTGAYFEHQDADFVVGKFDFDLNEIWIKYLGTPGTSEALWTVLATSDGGCLLAGTTYDYINSPVQERDILLYKLDAEGNVVTGGNKTPKPNYQLQVYPNPTSSTLVIDLEQNQSGTFQMINTLGQKVGSWDIHDRTTLPVGHLTTGIYFYHFVTEDGQRTSGQVVIAR